MSNYVLIKKLSDDTLNINNFGYDLMSCIEESGHSPTLYAFLVNQLKSNYTREELLNFEFPSYSVFYGMDKTEFNKLLDVIYEV